MSPILPCICHNRKKNCQLTSTHKAYYHKDKSATSVMEYIVLAASYRMDWLDTCKSTSRMLLAKLPFGDRLKLHYISYYEERVEQMDQNPEHVSDPVTEQSHFQLLHQPSEHRGDCQHGHSCAGIPEQPIIWRSTSSRAKGYSYQANTEQLLDILSR